MQNHKLSPSRRLVFMLFFIFVAHAPSVFSQTEKDYVNGKLITFNSNGFWCWFQDERAIVDTVKKKLVVGSVANNANIDAVVFDIPSGKADSKTTIGRLSTDDHNAPAFLLLPNGKYLAMFADHYDKYNSHYCIFDGQKWSSEKKFDWTKIPGGTNYTIAYSNLMYLGSEGQIYNFARANDRSPNFLLSTDSGATWKFGGQLTTDPSSSYNKGYYKYWGNGLDRIDFCFTEQHPRDFPTSIFHGYIKDGKSFSTDGKVADDDIFNLKNLPTSKNFTQVFANNTKVNGVTMTRCWQCDLMRYDDGVIAIIFKARANNSETDHRFLYSRYDGTEWKTTYLGKAGSKMYASEQDYIGLGALCPNDKNTVYLSSTFNPADESNVKVHEIFKGVTKDKGATWTWEAVTKNSSKDNFRPIVPAWDSKHYALLWCRGTYSAAQQFNAQVVGIIDTQTTDEPDVSTFASEKKLAPGAFSIDCPASGAAGPSMTIRYSLTEEAFVTLRVYSTSGKEAATLVNGKTPAGTHSVEWNTRHLPAGMYIGKISVKGVSKMIRFSVI